MSNKDEQEEDVMLLKETKSNNKKGILSNSSKTEDFNGVNYNTALTRTIYSNPKSPPLSKTKKCFVSCCGGCFFQVLLVIIYLIIGNEIDNLIFGLSFLEKEPPRLECLHDDTAEWKECTKQEICDGNEPKDHYRPVKEEDEYIDNFVEKFDLLCEPKFKVGLIGSFYFIGICTTLTFVPPLADAYGRKWVFNITLLVSIIAQFSIIMTNNLYQLYFYMFLIGATFAGRIVVGLGYVLEFLQPKWHASMIYWLLVTECLAIVLLTAWYQFVERSWLTLHIILLVTSICTMTYFIIAVPESPKWLYTWNKYEKAKEYLAYVAWFNGLQMAGDRRVRHLKELKFDLEVLEGKQVQMMSIDDNDKAMELKSEISKRRQLISQSQYYWNLVKLTIFWTAASFSFYLLMFMNKYYEGSLYVNQYLDGLAGIIGSTAALYIYGWFRMKWSFIFSTTNTLIGSILLLLFQQNYVSASWITDLGVPPSSYPEGSHEEQEYYLGYLIPAVVFYTKIFVNMTFQFTYQASFGEDIIFPFYKRATSIGICNFIARAVTISSSLVAELDKPWPAYIQITVTLISFIDSFFLPSYAEEEEFEAKMKELSEDTNEDESNKKSDGKSMMSGGD